MNSADAAWFAGNEWNLEARGVVDFIAGEEERRRDYLRGDRGRVVCPWPQLPSKYNIGLAEEVMQWA